MAGVLLAGSDLPELAVVASMAWVGALASGALQASAVEASGALQANAVQTSGSESHVPLEVDQIAFPGTMVGGSGGGGVLVTGEEELAWWDGFRCKIL